MARIQIEVLLLVAVGYLITRLGILSAKARADITNVIIYVILPCNIFMSFQQGVTSGVLWQCGVVFAIAFAAQLLYLVLGRLLYRRASPQRRAVLRYATICNNAGFMGLPIIESVFGSTGLLYGAIILIPLRSFMWTAGLSQFTVIGNRQKIKALAAHPCIWAVILGFAFIFLPFELPEFLTDTISALGVCVTALSMLMVGSILSEVDIKGVFDRDCFYYSGIRLIAIPAFIYAVLTLLGADALVTGACVLSSAMPAATMTAMLAEKYGCDGEFASKLVFVSTALSLVTLPLAAGMLL